MTPQLQQLLDLSYHSKILKRGDYDTTIKYIKSRLAADETLMTEARMEHGRLEALANHCLMDLAKRDYVQDVYRGALAAVLTTP